MNSLKKFFQIWVILAVVTASPLLALAQIYQIGDVYEFPDGSKGVICYVNPDNPVEGWAVALNDIGWVSNSNNKSYFLLDVVNNSLVREGLRNSFHYKVGVYAARPVGWGFWENIAFRRAC